MMTNFYLDVQQMEMNNEKENAVRSSTFNAVFKKQTTLPVIEVNTFKQSDYLSLQGVNDENAITTPLIYNKLRERKATDKGEFTVLPQFCKFLQNFPQNSPNFIKIHLIFIFFKIILIFIQF